MSPTSPADYPNLGFDPTPGDYVAASNVADYVRDAVDALEEIRSVLHGADDGEWRGKAAIAFRDLLDDDLRPKIDEAYESFGGASRVISNWKNYIDTSQAATRRLEQRAEAAAERLASAESTLSSLPDAPDSDTPPPGNDEERQQREDDANDRDAANQKASAAQGDLDDIRDEARRLGDDYREEGKNAADQLQSAMDLAPNEPGFWSSIGDAIGNALSELGEALADLGDWVLEKLKELAPLLKIIGDIAGLLSAICGLLAFIPGLQFLAIPALILGGVALVAHYLEAAGQSGSFLKALTDPDVIMDAIGLALGIGALKVGSQLVNAARATGNTRMVPQLIGPAQEMVPGFFSMMRSSSYTMETSEFVWRTVNLKLTQGSLFATGWGAKGNADTIGDLVTWDWGPLTQAPVTR